MILKVISFEGGGEIILRSGADVYGKLIANVIKEEAQGPSNRSSNSVNSRQY